MKKSEFIKNMTEVLMQKQAGLDEDQVKEMLSGFADELEKKAEVLGSEVYQAAKAVLQKEAAFNVAGIADTFSKGLSEGAGKKLGSALVGALVGGALYAGSSAHSNIVNNELKYKFERALQTAIQNSRILRQADKAKVTNYAETIFKFAPNVASDANLLAQILSNVIMGDGIDPQTMRMLTELEGKFRDQHSGLPELGGMLR